MSQRKKSDQYQIGYIRSRAVSHAAACDEPKPDTNNRNVSVTKMSQRKKWPKCLSEKNQINIK